MSNALKLCLLGALLSSASLIATETQKPAQTVATPAPADAKKMEKKMKPLPGEETDEEGNPVDPLEGDPADQGL